MWEIWGYKMVAIFKPAFIPDNGDKSTKHLTTPTSNSTALVTAITKAGSYKAKSKVTLN